MQRLDWLTIHRYKVPGTTLMKRAGMGAFQWIQAKFGRRKKIWTVLGGAGNNGGDAWVVASLAMAEGYQVQYFLVGEPSRLSADANYYYQKIKTHVQTIQSLKDLHSLKKALINSTLIVDGLFGTGLSRPLRGLHQQVIKFANAAACMRIALDIPSGISSDSGEIMGEAIQADYTVTFELPKWGHFLKEGANATGSLIVIPIGIKKSLIQKIKSKAQMISGPQVKNYLPKRRPNIHKASFGRALIIAGSKKMPGAGILASTAVLRSGCGLATLFFPAGAIHPSLFKHPENILTPITNSSGVFAQASLKEVLPELSKFKALGLGCGIGLDATTTPFVKTIVKNFKDPMVVDADGLFHIQGKQRKPMIVTPHPGEMARLLKTSIKFVEANRIKVAMQLAKQWNVYVLLKGHRSLVATPRGQVYINPTGSVTLATAGSGDVLTGLITGFLAQGLNPLRACLTAVYLHGRAGDYLYEKFGDRGTTASDLLKTIPQMLKELNFTPIAN